MRYFVVKYYTRPTGKMDEVVNLARRLRDRDLATASVILDFKNRTIIKANLMGEPAIREWETIVEYYRRHYRDVIESIENDKS